MSKMTKELASALVKGQVISNIEVSRYEVTIYLEKGGFVTIKEDGPEGGRLKTDIDVNFNGEVQY